MPFEPKNFTRLTKLVLASQSATGASFTSDNGIQIQVDAHAHGTFRVRLGKAAKATYASELLALPEPSGMATTAKSGAGFKTEFGNLTLELLPNPLRIRLLKDGKEVLSSSTDDNFKNFSRAPLFAHTKPGASMRWAAAFDLKGGEAVYGVGEHHGALNLRGQLFAGANRAANLNQSFVWSGRGYGVFAHTHGAVQQAIGYPAWSSKSVVFEVEDECLDLFFFLGSPAEILNAYSTLIGRAAVPPIWSLGAWLEHATGSASQPATAQHSIDAAKKLREQHIPADVVCIDARPMAEDLVGVSIEWDRTRFGDAVSTFSSLRNLNFKAGLVQYPYVSSHSGLFEELAEKEWLLKTKQGKPVMQSCTDATQPIHKSLSPFGLIDFTLPQAFKWWVAEHERIFRNGADVLQTVLLPEFPENAVAHDGTQGAALRAHYANAFNRAGFAVSEKFGKISPQAGMTTGVNAPLVWGTPAGVSSQRHGVQQPLPTVANWAGLKASIQGALSSGLSGMPFYASSVGGRLTSTTPDNAENASEAAAELYLRWLQHSVFSSHQQFAGVSANADALSHAPWQQNAQHNKDWLQFRTRLLPYIMGAIEESARNGLPVARAMPLAFPLDKVAHEFELQYLFGPSLLVAPVCAPGGKNLVYLPAGNRWYDLNNGDRYEGGQLIEQELKLGQYSVFGKEGHMLALGPLMENGNQFNSMRPLDEVWIFGLPQFEPCVSRNRIRLMHMSGNAYLKGLEGLRLLPSGDLTLMRRGSEVRVSKAR